MLTLSYERTQQKRFSNYELLRIIAMLAIVIYHLCIHTRHYFEGVDIYIANIICSLMEAHVTLFILISGFFSIKLRWQSVLKLLLACIIIGLPLYILEIYLGYSSFSYKDLFLKLCPISRNTWWFIGCYFQLMLVSPLLNVVLKNATQRELLIILLLYSFMVFVLGGIMHDDIDIKGQNLFHFTFIYLIGGFLRKNSISLKCENVKQQRCRYISIFGVCSVFTAIINILAINYKMPFQMYNNPFVVGGAISIFLLFGTIKIQNYFVNIIASSSLIVYMIHDERILIRPMLVNTMGYLYGEIGHLYFLIVPFVACLIYILGIIVDRFYIKPLISILINIFEKAKIESRSAFIVNYLLDKL